MGILKAIYISKILLTFVWVSYNKINNFLEIKNNELIKDNHFVLILL